MFWICRQYDGIAKIRIRTQDMIKVLTWAYSWQKTQQKKSFQKEIVKMFADRENYTNLFFQEDHPALIQRQIFSLSSIVLPDPWEEIYSEILHIRSKSKCYQLKGQSSPGQSLPPPWSWFPGCPFPQLEHLRTTREIPVWQRQRVLNED